MITLQPKNTKETKAILLIKIHQDISSKTMKEIPIVEKMKKKKNANTYKKLIINK